MEKLTAEECWYLIQILSNGDKEKIKRARATMYQMLNHKHRGEWLSEKEEG